MDSDLSGFDPRVRDQLIQLSLQQGQAAQSKHTHTPSQDQDLSQHPQSPQTTQRYPRSTYQAHVHQNRMASQPVQPPPNLDAFPPLGSDSLSISSTTSTRSNASATNVQAFNANRDASAAAQEFFSRARGYGRGNARQNSHTRRQQIPMNEYPRPSAPPQPHLHNTNSYQRFGGFDSRRLRHRVIEQADFLEAVSRSNLGNMLTRDEITAKQHFSRKLESLARQVVREKLPGVSHLPQARIRLQPYGSLVNSFGLAGCDIDLLMTVEQAPETYLEIPEDVKRDLEKVLLEHGIGARLLVNTRVPILKVYEKPSPRFLRELHMQRDRSLAEDDATKDEMQKRSPPVPPPIDLPTEASTGESTAMDVTDAAAVPLPQSPISEHNELEPGVDCGIQCDINFTGHVALCNTRMLWTYGQCDQRVRAMGVFVKNWAKARDINTPYRGTLSSYGYILMVLHYCINVADPPLLPNLQQLAKNFGWNQASGELFQGLDVRYEQDSRKIREAMAQMPRNSHSLGHLLRGFFQYYGTNGGFRWSDQVVSIRSLGGILSKQEKDWIRARWTDQENTNVRQRYLLAIEDPFETTHNVARTVGHNGIVAIRNEFRRAWKIIEGVQRDGSSWTWVSRDGLERGDAFELLARDQGHGDTLQKDKDGRKLRQMREKLEAQEALVRKQALEGADEQEEPGQHLGTFTEEENALDVQIPTTEDPSILIHDVHRQDDKVSRMRSRLPDRKRLDDNDVDNDTLHNGSAADEPSDQSSLSYPASTSQTGPSRGAELSTLVCQQSWAETSTLSVKDQEASGQSLSVHHEADAWRQDTAKLLPQSQTKSILSPDAVGESIPWTTKSRAGLWLLQRDQAIRDGTWNPPTAGEKGRLNAAFPYDPTMTRSQLTRLNTKLEKYYKQTFHQSRGKEIKQQHAEAVKIPISVNVAGSNDEQWAQNLNYKPIRERSLRDWPVGSDIPWSRDTGAGLWLCWRDRQIKAGTWRGVQTNSLASRLDATFPYSSDQTFANIERFNSELDLHFQGIEFPNAVNNPQKNRANTKAMHEAIDCTIRGREERESQNTNQDGSTQQANAMWKPDAQQLSRDLEPTSKIGWDVTTGVGSWLQRRDEMIQNGTWRNVRDPNSIFAHLQRLYPYEQSPDLKKRERQNEELRKYFSGILLPHGSYDNAEPAYNAVLKLVEGRKDHVEASRVKSLLEIFQSETMKSLKTTRDQARQTPRYQTTDSQDKVQKKSIESIKAVSSRSPAPSADDENVDTIRKRRLAYYEKKTSASVVGSETGLDQAQNAEVSARRDSAAEGSWNEHPSPLSCLDLCLVPVKQETNLEKPESQVSPPAQSSDPFQSKDQHDPATTDEAAGEVIPNTLCPDTWMTNRDHRHEDPRVIPFPRTLDFPFDKRQLADIDIIRSGGNGCVRGGISPYQLETDKYSWAGAGAMAQRTGSREYSRSRFDCTAVDVASESQRRSDLNLALLGFLPYVNEEQSSTNSQ